MNTINIHPFIMIRFADAIDNRIYRRLYGVNVSYNLSENDSHQELMINIRSNIDGLLISRITIRSIQKCSNAITIEHMDHKNGLIKSTINIGSLYSAGIADRIFNEIQSNAREWFKEGGK